MASTRDARTCQALVALLCASNDEQPAAERIRLLCALDEALVDASCVELGQGIEDPFVSSLLSRLDQVTDRTLPLAELVRGARVSRSTLLRRFRRALGGSPHDYHMSVRRNLAFDLMNRGRTVAEASLEAGFHDQAHFTRHARTILAMGPGSWRRRRRVR